MSTNFTVADDSAIKAAQIRSILSSNGIPSESRFVDLIASKVTRADDGGLLSVAEAMQELRRTFPHLNAIQEQRQSSYRPGQAPQLQAHELITPDLEAKVRHYFGPGSKGSDAQALHNTRPDLYTLYKFWAVKLGLVA